MALFSFSISRDSRLVRPLSGRRLDQWPRALHSRRFPEAHARAVSYPRRRRVDHNSAAGASRSHGVRWFADGVTPILQPPSSLLLGASGVGVAVGCEVAVGVWVAVGVSAWETVSPVSENVILNVGGVLPPMMSVPIRSQSGAKSELRIQACKSPLNGVPGATIGFGADTNRKSPPATWTSGRKK